VERLRLDRLGQLSELPSRALRWARDREEELRPEAPGTVTLPTVPGG